MNTYYVYIISNKNRSTLYVDVTNDLVRRVYEHKTGMGSKFAIKYNLNELIYYEQSQDINSAIKREKQIKNWYKEWKWELIKTQNKDLIDLSNDWYDKEIHK